MEKESLLFELVWYIYFDKILNKTFWKIKSIKV